MPTRATKIRVGIFVVATTALLAVVIFVWGGMRLWERDERYHILFSDSVYGLELGANVYLNGVRVGRVTDIEPDRDDLRNVRVTIAVNKDTPIRTDTRAVLVFAGITGLKIVDLREGTQFAHRLPPGSVIPEGETTLDILERRALAMSDRSEELMQRANAIVNNLLEITDPKHFAGIPETVNSARIAADRLARSTANLDALVMENRTAIRRSLAAIETTATTTSTLLRGQVSNLIGKANELVAGMNDLVRANEAPLRSAVFDLRQASRNFKELSREVRQRPSRLIYSQPPKPRKLP
jgi:phospholipid/cholesterol/gamma-HCH transport system substrate-binding protein